MSDSPGLSVQASDFESIDGYHAHVYFTTPEQAQKAQWLRVQVADRYPDVRIGRWHERPVGPHTQPMFQLAFCVADMPRLLPWLMCHRQGLSILVHPQTRDTYRDHADYAAWLGVPLPLNLSALPGTQS